MTPLEKTFIDSIIKRDYTVFVQSLCQGVNLKVYYQGQDLVQYIMSSYLPEPMVNFFVSCALTEPYKNDMLCYAAAHKPQYIKQLLERGADINAKNNFGQTPLLLATKEDMVSHLEYLWDKGANPFIRDDTNFGVFSIPASFRQYKTTDFLISRVNSFELVTEFETQLNDKYLSLPVEQMNQFMILKTKYTLDKTLLNPIQNNNKAKNGVFKL